METKGNVMALVQEMGIEHDDLMVLIQGATEKFKEKKQEILIKINDAHEGMASGNDFEFKEQLANSDWITPEILYEESLRVYGHASFKHLYNSTFISAYAIFEYYFKRIAEIDYGQINIKYSDLKGQGIEVFKKYIERVIGCNLNSLNQKWKRINEFREVRNLIVHDNFVFGISTEDVWAPSKKYKEIKSKFPDYLFMDGYSDTTFYISDEKFIQEFISITTEYLNASVNLLFTRHAQN